MSSKEINWTAQQQTAIQEHKRSVFVSASAGTGKTAVLSGSCVNALAADTEGLDIWNLLVLTFTDMAADQMRSRVARQLNSAINAENDDRRKQRLRRQLILLGAADISTIHSFCKRLITQHFYELDIDPTFRVIDSDEARLLKTEVLEKTIGFAWRQPNLANALRRLLARRDLRAIEGFPSVIIEISDFLDCVVSRRDWLERAANLADAVDPFATGVADVQRQIVEESLSNAIHRIEFALKIYQSDCPAGKWSEKCCNTYLKPVQQLLNWLNAGRWDTAVSALADYKRPVVNKPKDAPGVALLVKETVDDAVDSVIALKNLAVLNPVYVSKLSGAVDLQTMVLVELVRYFDNFYSFAKKNINCLDFADLEHHALRLLTGAPGDDKKTGLSKVALKLRQKYKYIFVDEYQDINSVQQAILDKLSRPDNVFVVGDPKQSIYQWRGANPDIFIDNLKRSSIKPADSDRLRVDLNVNFRSEKPVLDFVNLVFSRLMTPSFAGIDYDSAAHLHPPEKCCGSLASAPAVELHILDKPRINGEQDATAENSRSDGGESFSYTGRQLQAAAIAQRINQMVDAGQAHYRDIVILMRSLTGRNDFIEALRLCGIPVSCQATAGYFKATEITDILALLKVIDNPRRDIELAAVLRCPIFKFTDTQLAAIRLSGKKTPHKISFYDCVIGFKRSDDSILADKLKKALCAMDDWRALARRGRLADLVWHICRRTGYLAFVNALPDGSARRANLLKLHDRAIQFENFAGGSAIPSLTRFIDFIEKLLASGQDWAPAEPQSAVGNTVRVLSVHKCKGLEFQVVFMADLDSSFNKKTTRKDCLLDEEMTLGLRLIDPKSCSRVDSLGYQVIETRNRRRALAEEMRILYVAMTRAMKRLVLVGCKSRNLCQKIITRASFAEEPAIPDILLETCDCHLDWLLTALSRRPRLHREFQTGSQILAADDNLFDFRFYPQPELDKLAVLIGKAKKEKIIGRQESVVNDKMLIRIKQSLQWQYPFGNAPLLPAKRSVTQFTHRGDEFAKSNLHASGNRKPKTLLAAEILSPPCAQPEDAKTLGSAFHLVLSQLELTKPVTADTVAHLLDKLVDARAITPQLADMVSTQAILKFFQSDLGQAALDKKNSVFREWPFTFTIPAPHSGKIEKTTPNPKLETQDSIIIQGIIDLLLDTPRGLIVIDFKTDDVSADGLAARAELYREQLDLYAKAAQAVLKKNVIAKWLYFLKPACKTEI